MLRKESIAGLTQSSASQWTNADEKSYQGMYLLDRRTGAILANTDGVQLPNVLWNRLTAFMPDPRTSDSVTTAQIAITVASTVASRGASHPTTLY